VTLDLASISYAGVLHGNTVRLAKPASPIQHKKMRGTSRSNFICENATPPSSKTFPDKWKSVQVILFAVRAVVPPKQQLQFWSTFNIMSKWHLENAALWITFSTNMHHQFHRFNAWVSFNYYGCSQLNCAHMRWSLGKSATSGSDCLTSQHMHMLAMRLLVLLCVFQQFALAFFMAVIFESI